MSDNEIDGSMPAVDSLDWFRDLLAELIAVWRLYDALDGEVNELECERMYVFGKPGWLTGAHASGMYHMLEHVIVSAPLPADERSAYLIWLNSQRVAYIK